MTRLLAALTALALALGMTALVAGPADAASTPQWQIRIYKKADVYGAYNSFQGAAERSDGTTIYAGKVSLQRRWKGSSTWSTVATGNDGYFTGTRNFEGTAYYRFYYAGGTDYNGVTWSAAFSPSYKIRTFWDLNDQGIKRHGKLYLKGHVKPTYKHKVVKIQIKKGHWKTYKKVRTTARSKFKVRVKAMSRKGTKYRIVVAARGHIEKTTSGVWRAYRY